MKRIFLIMAVTLLLAGNSYSQDESTVILLNHKTLAKKATSSDAAIIDAKKSIKANTWASRAKLFQDVDNQGLEQAQLGMDLTTLKLFYKEPISIEEEDGVTIYTYEFIKYMFENSRLAGWTRIEPIHPDPLTEALNSYKKAIELTEEGKKMKLQEKYKPKLDELKTQFMRSGQNNYFHENYNAALADFESLLAVNELPIFEGTIDTLMITYCGIVARDLGRTLLEDGKAEEGEKMYRKTIDYYSQLADMGANGSAGYIQMTRDFYAIGDTLGAIENLKKGIKQYPDSSILVTVTAQAYYLLGDNEKGIEFVDQIIEDQPTCAEAYYWKGLLITNEGDVEEDIIKEALGYYDKALEIDPMNTQIWYQSGYVYYAVGANYYEQESYEDNGEFRDELKAKGVENYEAAASKLEKAYETGKPEDGLRKESLDLLKRVYYKLYGDSDERYLGVIERLNNL